MTVKTTSIKIKPENKGKLHKAMGISEGKKIPAAKLAKTKAKAKSSGNVKLEKEAVFAQNAKKWKK